MKLRCLIFGLLLTTTAAASTPSDYAQQWPVNAQGEGAYAIKLNEEIYRIIQKNDLSDLSAFNAAGEALPFGPMPASYSPLPASWVQARAFPLPKEASQNPEQLRLHVQRSAAGDLSLDANFAQQASVGDSHDWIIDLDSDDQGIEALQVELSDNAGDFNAQLTVLASDDLQQWQSLQTASIVSLQQDGQRLQRLLIELPGRSAKYLRVQSLDAPVGLQIKGFKIKQRPYGIVRSPPLQWMQASYLKKDGRGFVYELPARISPEQLNVELKNTNSIAQFFISARQNELDYWQPQGSLTVFRLRAAGVSLDNDPSNLQSGRVRYWRIETGTEIQEPPVLKFSYRPELFLLLTHGAGPYVVAAGSMTAQRDQYPLDVLISQVRQNRGQDWKPEEVGLGKATKVIANMKDLGKAPTDWRSILLWSVLLLGAGAVILMVLKLLSNPPKA
ncbi:MAG TPA: DUF3999 family protein [Arenimonas sp.]|nr:DUF3999 family protein [Arenimonas sp.]